jgi:ethanolamine utilization protein EutA
LDIGGNAELLTVGVDVGSATSQVNISKLEMMQVNDRYVVSRREVVYESDILLTPYLSETMIDSGKLMTFLDAQYALAGVAVDDIDAGTILLTGLALARQNSRRIADIFARHGGKFITVSAGDFLEARLACKGAGVEELSSRLPEAITHIDIGGGTTKYCYVSDGHAMWTAAINVGSRIILIDEATSMVTRIEPPGRAVCEHLGIALSEGDYLDAERLTIIVEYLAGQILSNAGLREEATCDRYLQRTPPLFSSSADWPVRTVTFSGGVSEYLYGHEFRGFGDLGRPLANAVMRRVRDSGVACLEPAKGIRATVVGASQYSVQLTGATVHASDETMLPLTNVPVVAPDLPLDGDELDEQSIRSCLSKELVARTPASHSDAVAIAVKWKGEPKYERIDTLARALASTADLGIPGTRESPLIAVCDRDIAGVLGVRIVDHTDGNISVLTLDSVEVEEFDFIDIGNFVAGTGALPVVVKSLLFPQQDFKGTRERRAEGDES